MATSVRSSLQIFPPFSPSSLLPLKNHVEFYLNAAGTIRIVTEARDKGISVSLQLLIRPLISSLQIFARVIYRVVAFSRGHSDSSLVSSLASLERGNRGNPLDLDREQQAARSRRVSRLRAAVESRFHPLAKVD